MRSNEYVSERVKAYTWTVVRPWVHTRVSDFVSTGMIWYSIRPSVLLSTHLFGQQSDGWQGANSTKISYPALHVCR